MIIAAVLFILKNMFVDIGVLGNVYIFGAKIDTRGVDMSHFESYHLQS